MQVRDWMNPRPLTVSPGAALAEARAMMEKYWVRHLVVAEGGRVAGILSDRDVRTASLPPGDRFPPEEREAHLARVTVGEAMTRDPRTVRSEAPLAEVARLMLEHRVSAAPVVDDGRLVGIVTETDIVRAFLRIGEGTTPP